MNRDSIVEKLAEYFKGRQDVEFAYLFGSYACGSEHPGSDIDIAVYLQPDAQTSFVAEYLNIKVELMELFNKEIDLVILNSAKPFLKSRIINKHVRILSRNSYEEALFTMHSLGEYFDVEPYMELQYQTAISRIKEGNPDG